jgi:hypothetical protein
MFRARGIVRQRAWNLPYSGISSGDNRNHGIDHKTRLEIGSEISLRPKPCTCISSAQRSATTFAHERNKEIKKERKKERSVLGSLKEHETTGTMELPIKPGWK